LREDLDIDGRIIVEVALEETRYVVKAWSLVDPVPIHYEHGNDKLSCSVKGTEFSDKLNDYQLLKKSSGLCYLVDV
jgi:hypothetical protein